MPIDMKDARTLKILRDTSLDRYQKSKILNVDTDYFFQNIKDINGNYIQETHDVQMYNFEKILQDAKLEGKTVLDLGCNCGAYSLESIKLGAKKCIALDGKDVASKFIEYLGMEHKIKYVKEDMLNFIPTEQIDITYLFNLLCYFTEEEAMDLIKKIISYTKERFILVDGFLEDYGKIYPKIIKYLIVNNYKFKLYTVDLYNTEHRIIHVNLKNIK